MVARKVARGRTAQKNRQRNGDEARIEAVRYDRLVIGQLKKGRSERGYDRSAQADANLDTQFRRLQ